MALFLNSITTLIYFLYGYTKDFKRESTKVPETCFYILVTEISSYCDIKLDAINPKSVSSCICLFSKMIFTNEMKFWGMITLGMQMVLG